MAKNTHSQWSSRMGFVLAATGSAVGLGNIWKFPYMVGQSGGDAARGCSPRSPAADSGPVRREKCSFPHRG